MPSVREMQSMQCYAVAFQRPVQGAEQRIRWAILTVIMMVVEIFNGWLFHSMVVCWLMAGI